MTLVDGHRAFHVEAGKVARVINQGNGAQAEKMLDSGTPFAIASGEVGRIIVLLKKELGAGASPVPRRVAPKTLPSPASSARSGSRGGSDDWESF